MGDGIMFNEEGLAVEFHNPRPALWLHHSALLHATILSDSHRELRVPAWFCSRIKTITIGVRWHEAPRSRRPTNQAVLHHLSLASTLV